MNQNEIEAKKAQLLALLAEAGHFPRPRTIAGLRYIESEPGIYEGHEAVVLRPTRARVAAARRRQGSGEPRQRDGAGVRITALDEEAWDDSSALRGESIEMVRIGEDYPRDWTAARRRGWKVESRAPSPVDARIEKVAALRAQLEELVVPLIRVGALPNPPAWLALIDDDVLDHENVGVAMQSLGTTGGAGADALPGKQREQLPEGRIWFEDALAAGVNRSTLYQRTSSTAWKERVDAQPSADRRSYSFDRAKLQADLRRTRARGLE